jgi:hypothetical protein
METLPKLPEKKLNLITDTFNGLVGVLRNSLVATGLPPMVIISPASTAEQREQYRTQGKVEYPNGVINLTGVSKIVGQGYNDALRRSGINVAQAGKNTFINFRLIPIMLTCSFKYSSQSLQEVLNFTEQWMFAEMDSQFFLQNESLKLNVQVKFSEDLSLPQQQFLEYGNFFYVESSLTVSTYTGRFNIRPNIKSVDLSFQLNNAAGDEEVIETLPVSLGAT